MLEHDHDELLIGARGIPRGLTAVVVAAVGLSACGPDGPDGSRASDPPDDRPIPPATDDAVTPAASIEDVLARHTDGWLELEGVEGTGIGLCDGTPCIRVFGSRPAEELRALIPERVEGYPVDIVRTEPFETN